MEYLILFAALLFLGMLLFVKGIWDARRQEAWQRKKLTKSFGRVADREYADGEYDGIPRYFERHQDGFFLDDITWNDLDMDALFLQMNTTGSSAGQEYLYAMLRTPCFSAEELARREELMRYFSAHEKERVSIQMLYRRMGRTGKYSLYDYLDFLDVLGERKNARQIVLDLLFIPAAALIACSPQAGLLALIVLLSFNISTYLKEKRTIEPYLTSFQYVFRTISLAERLCREKIPVLEGEQEKLRKILVQFKQFKRSSRLGMRTMGGSGSPLDVLLDYINMMLHLDILAFNSMLKQVRAHAAEIDSMLSVVGRIDALIAAAGYRESLDVWCVPEEVMGDGMYFALEQMYHPLLKEAVKNDIIAVKGVLLTGSNASGKSTFLKAVALNVILAETIHACCAVRYRGRFFRVMTSMALRDDLGSGESYYIVEIKSLKRILEAGEQEGRPVLCFVDEVLRGTNTVERIAASAQILKSLCRPGVCCFAATHDIELTHLLEREYANYHFEEEITEGDIRFPYRLMEGRAVSRNAIRLLSIMGYDEEIIEAAEEMAAYFVENGSWENKKRKEDL